MSYSDWKQIDFSDEDELYYIIHTKYGLDWNDENKRELKQIGENCKKYNLKKSSQSITHGELYEYIGKFGWELAAKS